MTSTAIVITKEDGTHVELDDSHELELVPSDPRHWVYVAGGGQYSYRFHLSVKCEALGYDVFDWQGFDFEVTVRSNEERVYSGSVLIDINALDAFGEYHHFNLVGDGELKGI